MHGNNLCLLENIRRFHISNNAKTTNFAIIAVTIIPINCINTLITQIGMKNFIDKGLYSTISLQNEIF